jgi:hypothetical protein
MRATPSWNTIDTAPRDTALELRLGSDRLSQPIGFACRLTAQGWVNAATGAILDIEPTHWRLWSDARSKAAPALHRVNAMLIGRELSARHTASMETEMPEQLSTLLDRLAAKEEGTHSDDKAQTPEEDA